MEFHRPDLIPDGLPELIYEVTPPRLKSRLKVIACPDMELVEHSVDMGNGTHRITLMGTAGRAHADASLSTIVLYSHSIVRWEPALLGTAMFRYWMAFLNVALHEIGHLNNALEGDGSFQAERYAIDPRYRERAECRANAWKQEVLDRIARDSARLGQPYEPGLDIDQLSRCPFNCSLSPRRLIRRGEYMASLCGGQMTVSDIISNLARQLGVDTDAWYGRLYGLLKRTARTLGINRFHTHETGRRYRFFSYAEAQSVIVNSIGNLATGRALAQPRYLSIDRDTRRACPQCGCSTLDPVSRGYSFVELACGVCGFRIDIPWADVETSVTFGPKQQRPFPGFLAQAAKGLRYRGADITPPEQAHTPLGVMLSNG